MNTTLDSPAIYGIINRTNGKLYVGSAINVRLRVRQHFLRLRANAHISKHLQSAYNLYGEGAFGVVVLEMVDDPFQLIPREQYYIDLFHPLGENGYNTSPTAGSTLGIKRPPFSDEWRQKLSDAFKGEKNYFYGKTHSDEAKQLISQKTKDRMADPTKNYFYGKRFMGEQNYMFGRTHTPEARAKIGAVNKGKKFSIEVRRRMSESRKGRPKTGKPVDQLSSNGEFIATYKSISLAAQSVETTAWMISLVLRGKNKTAKGFAWRYAN
jgi:group I intron endonuclease